MLKIDNIVSVCSALILLGFGMTNLTEFDKYREEDVSYFENCLDQEGNAVSTQTETEFYNLSKAGFAFGFIYVIIACTFMLRVCDCKKIVCHLADESMQNLFCLTLPVLF